MYINTQRKPDWRAAYNGMYFVIIVIYLKQSQRARDAIITSSLREHDVADVVLT